MTRPVVLVVEDDVLMRGVITLALRSHGYEVNAAGTGRDALRLIEERAPDVMLLDIGLPDIDGIEVTTSVRRKHELPIIILSARGDEEHQVRALDEGANDYVVKPFREGALLARIRVALRTPRPAPRPRDLVFGDLRLDIPQQRLFLGAVEVALTPTEFKLLYQLALHPDQVVTHHQLLREVWGPSRAEEIQYLRVYMKQLRQKIERDPARPERVLTALGVGYRLVNPQAPA